MRGSTARNFNRAGRGSRSMSTASANESLTWPNHCNGRQQQRRLAKS